MCWAWTKAAAERLRSASGSCNKLRNVYAKNHGGGFGRAIWRAPEEINTGENMIANLGTTANGRYTVTNRRNGYHKTYEAKR